MRRVSLALVLTASLGLVQAPATIAAVAGPTPASTGNLLVLLDRHRAGAAATGSLARAVTSGLHARLGAPSVPQIGLITVRPPAGLSLATFARELRAVSGVAVVEVEHRYAPRVIPDDPALTAPDPASGVVQWVLEREGFYSAWNISRGAGALIGVIDTGIDATHPDLARKIAAAVDQQERPDARGNARTDEVGHGTHVASMACADTDNGIGLAGAGYDCRLVIEKSDFSDSSIAAAVVDATDRHVQALNMSFGPATPGGSPAPASEVRALGYARAHKVVLVAAAADSPTAEQGDPGNVLQPAGTGPVLSDGLGLDVTAASYDGSRATFAGYGSEVSMAAFGTLGSAGEALLAPGATAPGLFGAFPAAPTDLEGPPDFCGCRTTFHGSDRYAYLQGTSMAAPQVAAAAVMMRVLNPYASLGDVLSTLKRTARRAPGVGFSSDLGWGILNAGAALEAIRRVDRLAPVSELFAPRVSRARIFVLRWRGHDQQRPGLIASGLDHYEVFVRVNGARPRLIARTPRHTLRFDGRPGFRYAFSLVAVDHAGNHEGRPADATTRVARGAR